MRQLFGTDGIRGRSDQYPLDDATMFALGHALAERVRGGAGAPEVLLGMDTRESGPRIAGALAAGLEAGGGRGRFIGIVPTPAVAYLCRVTDSMAGISISASHNPFEDNGVKLFGHDGMKLSDRLEKEIEDELLALRGDPEIPSRPALLESPELIAQYEEFLVSGVAAEALSGKLVVLDTGHGAAYRIGPEVFRRAGARTIVIHDQPDGRNINEGAGALHPEVLSARVRDEGADFGVAFDGDADRAIFVDDQGLVRNGDEILYLWAVREQEEGTLANSTVVATVMSNIGFERQLERRNIKLVRAAVGDKYVLEAMLQHGAKLGGEQSGHIIDLQKHTTGDGLHTALVFGELLARNGGRFSDMPTFEPMPQILLNERVKAKPPLEALPAFSAALDEALRQVGEEGRILIRYSGTENLVRVMVEGPDDELIRGIAARLAGILRHEIASS
jgi:phosphoglucosamine mutase